VNGKLKNTLRHQHDLTAGLRKLLKTKEIIEESSKN